MLSAYMSLAGVGLGASCDSPSSTSKSSGAIHRVDPLLSGVVGTVLDMTQRVASPKSQIRAFPRLSTRMLSCSYKTLVELSTSRGRNLHLSRLHELRFVSGGILSHWKRLRAKWIWALESQKQISFTNFSRLTAGSCRTYFRTVRYGIQRETICSEENSVETPRKGTMFGCESLFQTTASLQKFWKNVSDAGIRWTREEETFRRFSWSSLLYILRVLTATASPSYVPRLNSRIPLANDFIRKMLAHDTSLNPPAATVPSCTCKIWCFKMCDEGSTPVLSQILPSQRSQRVLVAKST